jgi:hypothetical protein
VLSACAFITAVIVVLGCVVSVRVMGNEFNAVLRDGGARAGRHREGRVGRVLVIMQVTAVTVLLFFGAMASVVAYRVVHADVGYDTRRLLSATIDLPPAYDSVGARRGFYGRVIGDMNGDPAVEGPLLRASMAPIDDPTGGFEPVSTRRVVDAASPRAYVEGVLGPLQTIGVQLRSGRVFDSRDDERGAPVAIISRALAERYWSGRSAVGDHVRVASDGGRVESREIVGVVSDVLMGSPFSPARSAEAIYLPLEQTAMPRAALLFRHRGDVPAAQAALYASLERIDPTLQPPAVSTYEEILSKSALIATSVTKLFARCFGFALLLAVTGTYGLMARSIGQRTREIGVRRALGAPDGAITRLLVGQGGRQLGVGVAFALPVLVGIAFGFASFFPIGLVTTMALGLLVPASIVLVVLVATYVPTRRALRVSLRDALWRD